MLRKIITMIFRLAFYLLTGVTLTVILPSLLSNLYARGRIHAADDAPSAPVAIVFGAGLLRDGSPTAVLRDRVITASQLYFEGKVQKLLMSGDNRFIDYNEPGAMRQYALDLGVPDEAIILDYAGQRTYDTCYRARAIFGVERALLVTQAFHLPRAVLTCNALGVTANGVVADQRNYSRRAHTFWRLREVPATLVAMWEVWVTRPEPILGAPEPIFPLGSSPHVPPKS